MKLTDLFARDLDCKPAGFDEEAAHAHRQYLDQSRTQTLARLRQLNVGIKDNLVPMEIALTRRMIDRLAVIYDRPPTRWLVRNDERISESDPVADNVTSIFERAQYDLAWRQADRLRALMRQVAIRFYPNDERGSVVLRVFAPYQVRRAPSRATPDSLDSDRSFALQIDSNVWEHWVRTNDGWLCQWVDEKGKPLDEQPYASTGGRSPYSQLPVQMVYDDFSGGMAWLPQRQSRTAFIDAINAQANDLWNLTVLQAHSQLVAKTDNATGVPKQIGPDVIPTVPRGDDLVVLDNNPKIDAVIAVMNNFIRLYTLSEDLPTAEFDDAKEVVTGAALKVASRALLARREAQVPLAHHDEESAFKRFRAVHNLHTAQGGPTWDHALIPDDLDLEVEIAELEIASDDREQLEAGSRGLALGTISVIDLIQSQHGLSRSDAIKRYQRIKEDEVAYPAKGSIEVNRSTTVPPAQQDGRSSAQQPDAVPDPIVPSAAQSP